MFHSPRHGRIQMASRVRTKLYIQCKKKKLFFFFLKPKPKPKTKQKKELRFDVIYHLQQKKKKMFLKCLFQSPFQSSSVIGCNKTSAFYFYWVVTLSSQVWAWIVLRHSSFAGFHPMLSIPGVYEYGAVSVSLPFLRKGRGIGLGAPGLGQWLIVAFLFYILFGDNRQEFQIAIISK